MMVQSNKVIMPVMMQWDYGLKERGESDNQKTFLKAFQELCQKVVPFWYDTYLDDIPLLQSKLLEQAEAVKPDLIIIFPYTDQFQIDTLKKLKEAHTTAIWFGDDCFRFEDHSRPLAPFFTHVITTDQFIIPKYRAMGIEPLLSEWAGPTPDSWTPPPPVGASFPYDVTFVGGANEVRRWFIRHLKKSGIPVTCFGTGWPEGRVSFEKMAEIMRNTRINLNLSNSVSQDIRYVWVLKLALSNPN